ncbi:MAG: hypothetical protein GXX84_00750 [Acidobacteria bacterium]|nr:hypothetical protein [Acidobacteriota bacterium]
MNLPFSEKEFLDVFAAYNMAFWPVISGLWVITAAITVRNWRSCQDNRSLFALLAILWAWSGIVYHWIYFQSINPAAVFFGALFLAQAALFVFFVFKPTGRMKLNLSVRGLLGGFFVLYGLLYPLVNLVFGLEYPRIPLFAVPCPTVLITAGVLLASEGVPRFAYLIPLIWTAIAGSAAILLHIRADFPLLAAGALLAVDMIAPRAFGTKTAMQSSTS